MRGRASVVLLIALPLDGQHWVMQPGHAAGSCSRPSRRRGRRDAARDAHARSQSTIATSGHRERAFACVGKSGTLTLQLLTPLCPCRRRGTGEGEAPSPNMTSVLGGGGKAHGAERLSITFRVTAILMSISSAEPARYSSEYEVHGDVTRSSARCARRRPSA